MADTAAASLAPLYVGTSGFSYPSWKDGFYPADARPRDFLRFYAERLPAVELNTSFYKLPSEEHFRNWAAQTPPGFRFAVKVTRRITHAGRADLFATFCERASVLEDRLGPLLVQFPETRPLDVGLLELFLGSLDPELTYAFEFRHDSWDDPEVDRALSGMGVARVNALDGDPPFRYLRLREPPYDDAALARWAGIVAPLLACGVAVYCFFKHEDEPTAPRYASQLLELAG